MTDKKQRQPRTPRSYESIEKGALSLGLSEKVALVKTLKESIQKEVEDIETKARGAKDIVNGL